MKLTSDYRRVRALFEYIPQRGRSYERSRYESEVPFTVGPFYYVVYFRWESSSTVFVDFKLININVTDEELIQMFSKVAGRQVSLEEAERMKRETLSINKSYVLGVAGSYVTKVFGEVLSRIRDYVEENDPPCIKFTSDHMGRTALYKKMIKRFLPDSDVSVVEKGPKATFVVCFDE